MRLPFNNSYPVTQGFGVNPQDYAQFGMKGHNGIDYGLPSGTQVVAATSGTVALLEDPPGFGNYIQITGLNYRTIYAHLQQFLVPNGASVVEGQLIGLSNNTGNSSGPHLHFGVKPIVGLDNNNGFFGAIDPAPLIGGSMANCSAQQVIDQFVGFTGNPPTDVQIAFYTQHGYDVLNGDLLSFNTDRLGASLANEAKLTAELAAADPNAQYVAVTDQLFKKK